MQQQQQQQQQHQGSVDVAAAAALTWLAASDTLCAACLAESMVVS
jgi:hypothetical protein